MSTTARDLFDAGVHFGHQLRRWNPRSKPYVFARKNGMSIIDLSKTQVLLEEAAAFLEKEVASGQEVMFVGTKRQAQEVVREAGMATQMPFAASRWMGGALTNFETMKSRMRKYKGYIEMERSGELNRLPGKEAAVIRRTMSRINHNFEGLLQMEECPHVLFVVDIFNEQIAVAEANRMGIPVIALVDTNSDPSCVQYPIPGNDDSVKSIRIIVDRIVESVQKGVEQRQARMGAKFEVTPLVEEQLIEDQVEVEVTLPEGYDLDEGSTDTVDEGTSTPKSNEGEAAREKALAKIPVEGASSLGSGGAKE